jgi:NAD(P)-dependent dehydrogenase (short-subunit alcohol dehydrogenase family)
MDLQLAGKRALVTGSSSGIGAAVARELAAEGCAVVVHGRNRARAEAVARECEAKGVQAAVALGSITDDVEADAVADAALAAFGGIDILVNSAGGNVRSDNPPWTEVSSEDWTLSFNLNVFSVIRLAKRLTPGMIERRWGRIINISSIGGTLWSGRLLDYGSAKAALDHLTGNLSRAIAGQGVTVNAIIPGTILTPQAETWINTLRQQNGWPDDFAECERIYTQEFNDQPVPRLGRAEEIAAAAAFLASPRSDFTTGALLRIDGGNLKGR